jgi:AcrR family transcriptional regulator
MVPTERPPTGAARRRVRISDEETGRRMLAAAVGMIAERGMSVSLEHLSLEEIIQAAGVARSSVYRRWPFKDLFFSDLLVELANGPVLSRDNATVARVLAEHLARELARPQGADPEQDRVDFFVELLRVVFDLDIAQVLGSAQWRTSIALHATLLGLPDGPLRRQIGTALAGAEEQLTAWWLQVARRVVPAAGYRLVGGPVDPEPGYRRLALAASALITGLVMKASVAPRLVEDRMSLAPFGTTRTGEWSAVTLAEVGLYLAHLEPDPAVRWTRERIAHLADEVHALIGG